MISPADQNPQGTTDIPEHKIQVTCTERSFLNGNIQVTSTKTTFLNYTERTANIPEQETTSIQERDKIPEGTTSTAIPETREGTTSIPEKIQGTTSIPRDDVLVERHPQGSTGIPECPLFIES